MILKNMRHNRETNLYEVTKASMKYHIDPALLDSIQIFFKDDPYRLIADWYKGLNEKDKALVNRRFRD